MFLFDIGAHTGEWAISNSYKNKILCVEASPITYNTLVNKVSYYNNIIQLNAVVCNITADVVPFYHCDGLSPVSTMKKEWILSPESWFHHHKDTLKEFFVKPVSLDSLISKYGTPDLIKIDVEGAEYEVICSLSQKVQCICFEWQAGVNEPIKQCVHKLSELGFTEFAIQYGDKYAYRPSVYDYTADNLLDIVQLIVKSDSVWGGMIWAR